METTICKYKIVQRVRERLNKTMETMKTSDMQIQNCMERQRMEETRETMESSGDT